MDVNGSDASSLASCFLQSSFSYPMDVFTPEKRSEVMSRIRGGNTKPELALRSMLHRLGYRFTVHGPKNKFLPGRPDLFSFSHPDPAPISRKPRLLRTSKHTK